MNKRQRTAERWEKFNFLVEHVIGDLHGAEAKLLMVYYRHSRVLRNKHGASRNFFRVSDAKAAETLGRSPFTIRDARKRLVRLGVIQQVKPGSWAGPPQYMITADPQKDGGQWISLAHPE